MIYPRMIIRLAGLMPAITLEVIMEDKKDKKIDEKPIRMTRSGNSLNVELTLCWKNI